MTRSCTGLLNFARGGLAAAAVGIPGTLTVLAPAAVIAPAAVLALAPRAGAQLPPAVNKAPAGTPVVIAIPSLEEFGAAVTATARTFGVPEAEMAGLGKLTDILKTPGLNAKGSAAFVIPAAGEGEEDPDPIAVVPVSDYAAMVKALGGEASGITEVKVDDKTLFARDLTGGFAALSNDRARLELFEGKGGGGAHFEKLMGAAGKAAAEGATAFMVMDMQANADTLRAGLEGFKMQLQMMAAMSGGEMDIAKMEEAADKVLRDGASLVVAGRKTGAGLKFDVALQFKEGSEYAGKFSAPGASRSMAGTIPDQPFLFAAAADTTSAPMREFFLTMFEASKQDMMPGLNPMEMIEKMQGMSMYLGAPPSMTNGLLLNTAAYIRTTDPAGYKATMKEIFKAMSGQEVQGITYQTTYETGAKAGERTVDAWSMKMKVDPDNPMAQQVSQFQGVLFGSTNLSGYIADAPGGLVVTYSKNSTLLGQMLEAAAKPGGAGAGAIQTVSEQLPGERVAEAYLGTKAILDTVTPMLGLFDFEVPENLPPLGFALTTTGGGFRFTGFAPEKVLETVSRLQKAAGGGMDEDEKPAEKTGQPKF